ncbi:type VI secretion system baseplate subunit TssF [Arcobacter sp. FWKO B]|uniref:type VI secretion system baseplate subunit TssF n=1 Tax=Arcobacter sp. FWKO B TaxID=2593672 RepID=UPI0018A393C0|nr:type VI secretion system baseplate subunit TssF [Arcobacter sp. FWKO B]QOG11551.1 type VI secretion system baseplate subunit TssF [Arcobacter sp. FWKO B]
MTINDYYMQEMDSLRTLGGEFANKNPGLAPYLSKEGQDPDVERLLEGFAFLTGRLRQQLDEELPEVAHTLTQLMWPNYIRPVPSYCIIAYEPLSDGNIFQKVPKDTHVCGETNENKITCKFRTCFNTDIHPIEVTKSNYYVIGNKSQLEINFSFLSNLTLDKLNLNSLRIYLNGSRFVSQELYLYFMEYVDKIEIELLNNNNDLVNSINLPNKSISPLGFGIDERMVPYPDNVFEGYIALQEYFSFEHKYLFFNINNLSILKSLDENTLNNTSKLRIKFYFNKKLASTQAIKKDIFMLHCTPAINLFEANAVPIRKNNYQEEYLLIASEYERSDAEVFCVESARGWKADKNTYENFLPFESFNYNDYEEYYSVRIKLSDDGERTQSYIRFSSSDGIFESFDNKHATVSVKLLCTNSNLPTKLPLGSINIPDSHSPTSHLKFTNITIPTSSYPPPIGKDFLWRMISNMSLNYLSLTDIKTLITILSTYDFLGAHDLKIKKKNTLMFKGLVSIQHSKTEMIYEGFPIRGIKTFLEIDVSKFTNIGEAYLLCCVLNEFFALYCNINSFHKLEVKMIDYDIFQWPPRIGYQQVI